MLNRNTLSAATPAVAPASSKLAALPGQTSATKKHRASTRSAYARDVVKFEAYGFSVPCTADDLLAFLRTQTRRVSPATALRRVMAIQHEHRRLGHASPTADPRVREAIRALAAGQVPPLDGKSNNKAGKPPAKKTPKSATPIHRAQLARIFDAMGTGMRSLDRRDRAMMLLAFWGLKRGVIASLNVESLNFTPDALLLTLPVDSAQGNDDSQRQPRPRTLAIPRTRGPLCAATAVEAWLMHVDRLDQTGPVFPVFDRSCDPLPGSRLDAAYLNCIVKKRARDACFSEAEVAGFTAESLRRGGAMERGL